MSYMSHSREAISRALNQVKTVAAHVNVREVFPINEHFARVVAQASAGATPESVMAGFRKQFTGITPVNGSFVSVSKNAATHTFEGIVGVVAERVVITDENRDQFKAVAGNMFMDEDEKLWTLKAGDAGQVMVKSICNDDFAVMQQLLSVASSNPNDFETGPMVQKNAEVRATAQGSDLVTFVSTATSQVEMGIVVASVENADGTDTHTVQVVRRNGETETVNREMIVAVAEQNLEDDHDELANVATAANIDFAAIAAYYSRMFARRRDYYDMFMARFRNHAFM